jgi:hypothetical protein
MLKISHKITLVTALVVLMGITTPAWALDWHDPEWTDMGCPSEITGNWFPITTSPYSASKIQFKSNGASLFLKKNTNIKYVLAKSSKDSQFLNFKRVSGESASFPVFLKVRPHIAIQNNSKEKKLVLCKIKIFLFETKQKAKQMSYLSWDIYSTFDILEVPHDS